MAVRAASASAPASELAAEAEGESLAAYREVVLVVFGLSCPVCPPHLRSRLLRVEGVETVRVDVARNEVTVRMAGGHAVTRAQIAQAVRDASLRLYDIRPSEAAEP